MANKTFPYPGAKNSGTYIRLTSRPIHTDWDSLIDELVEGQGREGGPSNQVVVDMLLQFWNLKPAEMRGFVDVREEFLREFRSRIPGYYQREP